MAAIDKIYANKEQHEEFLDWAEHHLPEALHYIYPLVYSEGEYAICNLPRSIDEALFTKNPPQFVKDRLIVQYGLESWADRWNILPRSLEDFISYGVYVDVGYDGGRWYYCLQKLPSTRYKALGVVDATIIEDGSDLYKSYELALEAGLDAAQKLLDETD